MPGTMGVGGRSQAWGPQGGLNPPPCAPRGGATPWTPPAPLAPGFALQPPCFLGLEPYLSHSNLSLLLSVRLFCPLLFSFPIRSSLSFSSILFSCLFSYLLFASYSSFLFSILLSFAFLFSSLHGIPGPTDPWGSLGGA